MIRKMYCIETDKNSLYVDKDVYDYIVSLEQQCIKQKQVIDKAMKYINRNLILVSILDGVKTFGLNSYTFDYEELLEILNGEDKEVPE